MHLPALNDTIVAVSTGWHPAPVGIVRLSGPDAVRLVAGLGVEFPPGRPRGFVAARVRVEAAPAIPALVAWFVAPGSYTGQDVVELHLPGSLPLLRHVADLLIAAGGRRALPGEFTSRAMVAGKLDAAQVEGVLGLMSASTDAELRQAARAARHGVAARRADMLERLTALLARVEANIDFVEEEDVRFVTADEARREIESLRAGLRELIGDGRGASRAGMPHVALVGPPNAGKSTLFNALCGNQRAIVSPVLGTTRDVLSAEIELDGHVVALQDSAGLGDSIDELELETHVATERAAQQADVVLWVQPVDVAWDARAFASCAGVPAERRVLVVSKADLGEPRAMPAESFAETVAVSAARGTGLGELRASIVGRLEALPGAGPLMDDAPFRAADAALGRAMDILGQEGDIAAPELVALELRQAHEHLADEAGEAIDEQLLERIMTQFCVGK